jgi:hypothetical protein
MESAIIRIIIFSHMLLILISGCKKEKNETPNDQELQIVAELPIMYQGVYLKQDEKVHITDLEGFDTIFSYELVDQIPDLQNLDFSKHDILVGADVFTHGIYKLEHHLFKFSENIFVYKLNVYYNITHPAGGFFYGIIINKLPIGSIINFEVTKTN